MHIPLGPNLRKIHYGANYLDPMSHTGLLYHGKVCITRNSLGKIVYNSNFVWANQEKLAETLNAVTEITNLTNLTYLDLSNNDFKLDMTSAAFLLPQLHFVNVSQNFVTINPNTSLCQVEKRIHNLASLSCDQHSLKHAALTMISSFLCKYLCYLFITALT